MLRGENKVQCRYLTDFWVDLAVKDAVPAGLGLIKRLRGTAVCHLFVQ